MIMSTAPTPAPTAGRIEELPRDPPEPGTEGLGEGSVGAAVGVLVVATTVASDTLLTLGRANTIASLKGSEESCDPTKAAKDCGFPPVLTTSKVQVHVTASSRPKL